MFRIVLDGFAEGGDGLVQLPLIPQDVAKVAVGVGIFRIEFDGLAVRGDGFVVIEKGFPCTDRQKL
jgi:hypothetical protein